MSIAVSSQNDLNLNWTKTIYFLRTSIERLLIPLGVLFYAYSIHSISNRRASNFVHFIIKYAVTEKLKKKALVTIFYTTTKHRTLSPIHTKNLWYSITIREKRSTKWLLKMFFISETSVAFRFPCWVEHLGILVCSVGVLKRAVFLLFQFKIAKSAVEIVYFFHSVKWSELFFFFMKIRFVVWLSLFFHNCFDYFHSKKKISWLIFLRFLFTHSKFFLFCDLRGVYSFELRWRYVILFCCTTHLFVRSLWFW